MDKTEGQRDRDLFCRPEVNTNALVYHWTQHADEDHLCPTSAMIEKYVQICVLCKEERRCGQCCIVCPRMIRHMGCEQMISCEYVKDVINSMGLLLDVDQWHEVYKNTVSDDIIQRRCKALSEGVEVPIQQLFKGLDSGLRRND